MEDGTGQLTKIATGVITGNLQTTTGVQSPECFQRVQRGDKVLYRVRFAGLDKETAEFACRQLKRGHFDCVALKN